MGRRILVLVRLFFQLECEHLFKIYTSSVVFVYNSVQLLKILSAVTESPITLFKIQMSQILIISLKDINLQYMYKVCCRE